MVQAIMAGRKTQTRRIVKPQPHDRIEDVGGFYPVDENGDYSDKSKHYANGNHFLRGFVKDFSPFGQPGDHLWVRETFYIDECDCQPFYKVSEEHPEIFKWTPSIHMPRWASRITLEITNVRVERLQDIKRDDAIKEGLIHVAGQIEAHWWNAKLSRTRIADRLERHVRRSY